MTKIDSFHAFLFIQLVVIGVAVFGVAGLAFLYPDKRVRRIFTSPDVVHPKATRYPKARRHVELSI